MTVKRRKYQKGIRIKANDDATTLEGEISVGKTDKKVKVFVDSAERDVVTNDQTQTLDNKSIDADNNPISNIDTTNLKAGVLVTDISAATADTELPSALAVKTALEGQNDAAEIEYDPTLNPETIQTNIQGALDDTGIASQNAQNLAQTAQTTGSDAQDDIDDHKLGAIGGNKHSSSQIYNEASGSSLTAGTTQAAVDELDSNMLAHINDTTDAHAASAITNTPTGNVAATTVQGAIDELQNDIDSRVLDTELTNHEADTSTHGVTTIAGLAEVQTLTNKTIDGAIITAPLQSDVKQDTQANLETYALTATDGQMCFATDTKQMYQVVDNALAPVGGGGGGLDTFYAETFEGAVKSADFGSGNDATFDNGGALVGSLADETVSPLSKTTSLSYTQAAGSLNDYVISPAITVDKKQQSQTVGLELYYTYTGDSDDIKIVGYDATGSEVMTLESNLIKASSTSQRLSVQFPVPSDSLVINWGIQVVVENIGAVLILDDVQISTNPYVSKDLLETQVVVIGAGNSGAAITASSEAVDFTVISDITGSWSQVGIHGKDTFTAPSDGEYTMTGAVAATSASISDLRIYINNSYVNFIAYEGTNADMVQFTEIVILNKGDTVSIRSGASITLNNSVLSHRIRITKTPEASDHIIAYNSRNAENSMVRLHTGNGHGSTNNKIRRFSTVVSNLGNAITYADSATLGASFTIEEDGVYAVNYDDSGASSVAMGLSLNSTELTTNIASLTVINNRLQYVDTAAGGFKGSASWSGQLYKDDVIRAHTVGTASAGSTATFTISKIGVGDLLGVPVPRTAYIKDVKSSGTQGGTFTSGAWQTRDLNTLSGDTEFTTLSANQFVLQPGKYTIEAEATAFGVENHKARLFNITDNSSDLIGTSEYTASAENVANVAHVKGMVIITSAKTFELQHRCNTTKGTNGLGASGNFSISEVYSTIKITKVS